MAWSSGIALHHLPHHGAVLACMKPMKCMFVACLWPLALFGKDHSVVSETNLNFVAAGFL